MDLGTLDMTNFNQQLAKKIATGNSETDKLAYLLGSYLGNYFGNKERKKQEDTLANIVSGAQQAPVQYTGDTIGAGSMTPEQQQAYNQQVAEIANMKAAPNGISVGVGTPTQAGQLNAEYNAGLQNLNNVPANGISAEDEAISKALDNIKLGNVQTKQTPTNGGMNNYNWDYIKAQAKQQGVSDTVLENQKADIQKGIAQRAREVLLPEIQRDMYGSYATDANGKQVFQPATTETMINGLQKLNELGKYDSETANTYSKAVLSNLQNDRTSADKLQNAITLAKIQNQNAISRDNNTARNNRSNAAWYMANGYNPKGGNNRTTTTKDTTAKDRDTAYKDMGALVKKYTITDDSGNSKVLPLNQWSDIDRQRYTEKHNIYMGNNGNTNVGNTTNTQNTSTQNTNPLNKLDEIFSGINDENKNDWDAMLGKDGIFQQATDYMRTIKDKKGNRMFSDDDVAKAITNYGKQVFGENSDNYQQLAHSFGLQTDTDKAIAAQEAELERDKVLNPQKYGIDPMQGVKDIFSGNFNDDFGRKIREEYNNKQ